MTPNLTNHPPRKGIAITAHKGGRTARIDFKVTPAEKAAIMQAAHDAGLSVADFVLTHPAITDSPFVANVSERQALLNIANIVMRYTETTSTRGAWRPGKVTYSESLDDIVSVARQLAEATIDACKYTNKPPRGHNTNPA